MYNKLSDAISGMSLNLSLAAVGKGEAQKALVQLKEDPALAKQVLDEISKMKPGQKFAVTAAMNPLVKTILMGLLTLAPAAFADEGGLKDLVNTLKSPSNISVEKINTIQDKAENAVAKKQLLDMTNLAKTTKPGAVIPTPQAFNLKGQKITITTQGQASLAQKATKMLNELGSSGASAEVVNDQAQAFAKLITRAHS